MTMIVNLSKNNFIVILIYIGKKKAQKTDPIWLNQEQNINLL